MELNKELKPFYVFKDKNSLYIKNINEETQKLSNNVLAHTANIDNLQNTHICYISTSGKVMYLTKSKSSWKKKSLGKFFSDVKNIVNIKSHIIDNYINLIICEKMPMTNHKYKITHLNFNTTNNQNLIRYNINNMSKNKDCIYKLNVSESSEMILEYTSFSKNNRHSSNNTLVFKNNSRKWSRTNLIDNNSTTIKNDIFDYCYSVNYKI